MPKITFLGAGSAVFAKNIIGDCFLTESLKDSEISLYDIDAQRLDESYKMLYNLNNNINDGRATIKKYLGVKKRKAALRNSDFIINAIQVGGYKPSTVIDFEIPKKFGLQQSIGDTLGIGGLFRALRTGPVMLDIARDIEAVCPDAYLLSYTNPMAMLTGIMLKATSVKTIGLCHSVQVCVKKLLANLELTEKVKNPVWHIAGINHMAWLLELYDGKKDIYPMIKKAAAKKNRQSLKKNAEKHNDMVRFEIMKHFGYYVTESSEHNAEYTPYWIKSNYPELLEDYNIPLDEYPRRCQELIDTWQNTKKELIDNKNLEHTQTHEYGSKIINAVHTGQPFTFNGNVLNDNLITNLPADAIVEVKCVADQNGITPTYVGPLPPQLAALNMTNINVHLLAIEAVLTKKKDYIYQAAMLDPHTSSELPLDTIVKLCDELIEAHGDILPDYI